MTVCKCWQLSRPTLLPESCSTTLQSSCTEEAHDWYRRFYRTLHMEMDGYYEAELTLRLAEISSYDMEDDYGEADEV